VQELEHGGVRGMDQVAAGNEGGPGIRQQLEQAVVDAAQHGR
jgi:hypothetical protein